MEHLFSSKLCELSDGHRSLLTSRQELQNPDGSVTRHIQHLPRASTHILFALSIFQPNFSTGCSSVLARMEFGDIVRRKGVQNLQTKVTATLGGLLQLVKRIVDWKKVRQADIVEFRPI
jgi:hypothetical protein